MSLLDQLIAMAEREREAGADNDAVYNMIHTHLSTNHPNVDAEHLAQLVEQLTDPDEEVA